MKFDHNNICAACNFNKLKWNQTIDWKEREKELIELCNRHSRTDGGWQEVLSKVAQVPGSKVKPQKTVHF